MLQWQDPGFLTHLLCVTSSFTDDLHKRANASSLARTDIRIDTTVWIISLLV